MRFTYLFGAGASAEIIPTVKQFSKALNEFTNLYTSEALDRNLLNEEDDKLRKEFILDLFELIEETEKHASIDTYARKLYITNQHEKLKKLKAILDSFLTAFQMTNILDKRYDLFLATLLNTNKDKLELPNNVNIISWNYDFQFELSLSNFLLEKEISKIESKFKFIPNQKNDFVLNEEFSLIKLNGSAGALISNNIFKRKNFLTLKKDYNSRESIPDFFTDKLKIYRDIMRNYFGVINAENTTSSILFAWEKDNTVLESRKFAKLKTKETEILIVIGYSFPTFNREIDKDIISNMYKLKKIIIQAPKNDIDALEFRIKSLISEERKINIQKVTALDEFFIPFEM